MRSLSAAKRMRLEFFVGRCFVLITIINALLAQRASAQTSTLFLVSPYFGQKTRTQLYSAGHPAYDFSMLRSSGPSGRESADAHRSSGERRVDLESLGRHFAD